MNNNKKGKNKKQLERHLDIINSDVQHIPQMNTQITFSENMIWLKQYDYDRIVNDNNEKTRMIEILKNNADILRNNISHNESIIKNLEKINDEYKTSISQLTDETKHLIEQIEKLENKIELLESELNYQKTNNDKMQNQINYLMEKEKKRDEDTLFMKFIFAIQDLDHEYKLECNMTQETACDSLKDLRDMRNECHYLNNNYKKTQINDRIFIIKQKINNMPANIKERFDEEFPDLIDELSYYLNNNVYINSNITQKSLNEINRWWTN